MQATPPSLYPLYRQRTEEGGTERSWVREISGQKNLNKDCLIKIESTQEFIQRTQREGKGTKNNVFFFHKHLHSKSCKPHALTTSLTIYVFRFPSHLFFIKSSHFCAGGRKKKLYTTIKHCSEERKATLTD